jgi:2'-5' RNA ligase
MRLFVALVPPADVLDNLAAAWAPHRAARDDLRWTRRDSWHVTLAFLGEVGELARDRLTPRLERAARRHSAFELPSPRARAAPTPAPATVIWTGLVGDRRALSQLAASVAAGARRAGATPPDAGRKYRPHLTIARCRPPADVRPVVDASSSFQGKPWTAGEIQLIRSRPQGQPRYQTLGSWPLATAPGP